jgi:archaeosine synthase beta-subunit
MKPPSTDDSEAWDAWITAMRPNLVGERSAIRTDRPAGWLVEEEPKPGGRGVWTTLTVFLVNRECPWRCLMCDLWRHTTPGPVPPGAVTMQLDHALGEAGRAHRQLKLYNAGSFFDVGAVSSADRTALAARCGSFERVVVECHPSLVGPAVARFASECGGPQLEVAMGLETVHPVASARLNKRMTPDDFRRAAGRLRGDGIEVRAFVLVKPPFLTEAEAVEWAVKSADFAFEAGASTVVLIPVRGGNGALEALARAGVFSPPRLDTLVDALRGSLALGKGRVLADLWDLGRFASNAEEEAGRRAVLEAMNRSQSPAVGETFAFKVNA